MKGMEELTKTYIYLAVTLVFITFAITPLYQTVDESTKNSARLQAKEIAGVINMMKASPSYTLDYRLQMPPQFTLKITGEFVVLSAYGKEYVENIIRSGVSVQDFGPFDFGAQRDSITIKKSGTSITVSSPGG